MQLRQLPLLSIPLQILSILLLKYFAFFQELILQIISPGCLKLVANSFQQTGVILKLSTRQIFCVFVDVSFAPWRISTWDYQSPRFFANHPQFSVEFDSMLLQSGPSLYGYCQALAG